MQTQAEFCFLTIFMLNRRLMPARNTSTNITIIIHKFSCFVVMLKLIDIKVTIL